MKPSQKTMAMTFAAIALLAYGATAAHAQSLIDPVSASYIAGYQGGSWGGATFAAPVGNTIDGSGLNGYSTQVTSGPYNGNLQYNTPNGTTPASDNAQTDGTYLPGLNDNTLTTGTSASAAGTTGYASAYGAPEVQNFDWVATGGGAGTTGAATGVNIIFNLGTATANITGFHYWNLDSWGEQSYGIATADVRVSNDSTFTTYTDLGTVNFTQAPVAGGPGATNGLYTGSDASLSFSGDQYVMFDNIVSFQGETGFATGPYGNYFQAGLSEIRFDEAVVPEPSTMALMGLGALGLAFLAIHRRHCLS